MTFDDAFRTRLQRLYKAFAEDEASGLGSCDVLLVATGVVSEDEDAGYLKCYALMTWLLGSELQGALLLVTKEAVTIAIASGDVDAYKKPLHGKGPEGVPQVVILDAKKDETTLQKSLQGAISSSTVVGTLVKEAKSQRGPVAEAALKASGTSKQQVNIASALARLLSVKDSEEVARIKRASLLSAAVFRYALVERIEKTIDQDKKVSHSTLSQVAEEAILEPKRVKVKGLKADFCDPCYPPIVQSASKDSADRTFDLKPSAESDDNRLEFGCIIASLGARYMNLCSNISRTLLVDPSPDQKASYEAVLKAQNAAIDALVPGAKICEAYRAAVKSLESSGVKNASALVAGLGKNVGFGTGIEYRDSTHILNSKNEIVCQDGMIFNVAVGCSNLTDTQNGNYALFVADTVHVRKGFKPDIFTASARKDISFISYELQGDDEEDGNEVEEVTASAKERGRDPKVEPGGRRRSAAAVGEGEAAEAKAEEERRRKHQMELEQRMLDRGRKRLQGAAARDGAGASDEDDKKKLDEVVAYKAPKSFPLMKRRQLYVDMRAEALIVPINGVPVPFHIATIKNASKSDEGKHTYLRVNFHTPIGAMPRGGMRAAQNAPTFPELSPQDSMVPSYIKELSFRSSNPQNLSDCLRKIKELVKRAQLQRAEALDKETLVVQEKVRTKNSGRVPLISDAVVRPPLGTGKNNRGTLEAHSNGFYYRGKTGHIEIVYANIRNAFFQEADKETIVLLHFHLKNHIVVGKKKTKDVQFYIEVMEAAVRLNDTRRRQFDQDELEEEQREREMRNRTNKLFLKFTKEVEDKYGLDFDIPYRSLAFNGAPRSAAVTLLPTVNCIIDVIDWPPFVLNLRDVEIAHFERVNLQLRNFDVVFVFKSFQDDPENKIKPTKDMWIRISAIESEDLNGIKKYLDEQEIKYYEGPMSLQWNNVLKNIREDLEAFYDDGGWQFLSTEGGEDEDGESEDTLEGDEEFEAEDNDGGSSSYAESSDEDDDESDMSGDMRAELEGDSDAGEDDLSSDEEGMDWDEAERKAKADDKRRGDLSDDDDDRRRRGRGAGGRKRNGGGDSGRKRRR